MRDKIYWQENQWPFVIGMFACDTPECLTTICAQSISTRPFSKNSQFIFQHHRVTWCSIATRQKQAWSRRLAIRIHIQPERCAIMTSRVGARRGYKSFFMISTSIDPRMEQKSKICSIIWHICGLKNETCSLIYLFIHVVIHGLKYPFLNTFMIQHNYNAIRI